MVLLVCSLSMLEVLSIYKGHVKNKKIEYIYSRLFKFNDHFDGVDIQFD